MSLPSESENVIEKLLQRAEVIVVDSQMEKGFCRVVDISSGKTGYVDRKALEVNFGSKIERSSDIFRREDGIRQGKPTVTVRNDTDRELTLAIDNREIRVLPAESISVEILAGSYKFHASAPRARPLLGEQVFSEGGIYTCKFYIRRSR